MADIWQWNTATTAQEVAAGAVSAREVIDAHLDRLDEVNPDLNAVTFDVRDEARTRADQLDAAHARGDTLGPLHGVPITIKENVDVVGQPTPNGMPAFRDLVAPADSPLVSHFKGAGAVIIGRTNAPEMSYRWHTTNPLRGETMNPWSAGRTPGGSSGGAASAVAAGVGTIAHGNDLGGSVRQPANCCGLVGLRPSLGRVAAFNPSAAGERSLALQLMSVQGPLARQVADARTAFEVMAQPSTQDPWYIEGPVTGRPLAAPVKVAVSYGADLVETDADVRTAIDEAAAHLADAGYDVSFQDPPDLEAIVMGWQSILATETKATVYEQLMSITSDDFQQILSWMFTDDVLLDLSGYVKALADRATLVRKWHGFMADYPLVLTPVSQLLPFAPNDDASSQTRFREILGGHAPLVAVNYLGLPAVAVPVTLAPSGPVGVQLIGQPRREDVCFDAAQAIEDRIGVMTDRLWTLGNAES